MLGTAPEVDVWLLLEYRPPWQGKALEENDLPPTTRAWLANVVDGFAAQGRKPRPQFIRQPEEAERSSITLYLASDGELRRFQGRDYEEVERLDLRSSALEPVSEAHYFVCTNGQRDLCCARYGLPTYARLRLFAGERAGQTTHVGGHRFAPNVLALPQGALYGRVFADERPGSRPRWRTGVCRCRTCVAARPIRLRRKRRKPRCGTPARCSAPKATR